MTIVRQHERQKPRKPDAYIERHLDLIERRADRIAFLNFRGVEIVSANDDRLAKPIADPVPGPGRMTLAEIAAQLMALAKRAGYRG
ncbi:hypothetical protein [Aliirhizobium cellulosilyticum]|uniref:Uncharacterized protein n=1 Tax=Aliirhizobium cellulosilyticum TaxID=393664 RepID=A0A7W6S7H7_9HYPH|nr:hypothetical protein [Rhizobium cellulosilyticum]MBB4347998.1 hypothetical protein [Rhizobium cellulosilyticum]MBB4409608.1 hypothetical protein [Rhizobium cellulosilyticum]MBB4444296.1 hypothetical protein [Rhizobium cellulosilyticum]